jgi:hypothetical protein
VVDYRKFLAQPPEHLVLPWLGGDELVLAERRLTVVRRPPRPGWYEWSVHGRAATPGATAPAPSLEALPKARGWWSQGRLVREGAIVERVWLADDEPNQFTPVIARRWHSGALLFESAEFETEVEDLARQALARGGPFEVKGTPAPLRAAWGLALLERVGDDRGIPFAPAEVRHRLADVAAGGVARAEAVLAALEAAREQSRRELEALAQVRRQAELKQEVEQARQARRGVDDFQHARLALAAAGALLESARLRGVQLEVVFEFRDTRFVALVDEATLQVIDSGICLGHPPRDDLLTLDSLPGVIAEAMDTDALVILRHP